MRALYLRALYSTLSRACQDPRAELPKAKRSAGPLVANSPHAEEDEDQDDDQDGLQDAATARAPASASAHLCARRMQKHRA